MLMSWWNRRSIALLVLATALLAAGCGDSGGSGPKSNTDTGSTGPVPDPTLPAGTARASLTFTASTTAPLAPLTGPAEREAVTAQPGVAISDFRIAIEQIEFQQQGEDMADQSDGVEFEGPFAVDLLDATNGLLAQTIGDAVIPAGTYEGIVFHLHKSSELSDPSDPLYNRSIYIAGTIDDGTNGPRPFVMWHDTGEEFFLTGAAGFIVPEQTTGTSLVVDFNLDNILVGIDLVGGAEFDAGLGYYDISPQSASAANQQLAEQLKNNLQTSANFGDDENGDGHVDDTEDVDESD